jgi:seryl-tRNA synthetase
MPENRSVEEKVFNLVIELEEAKKAKKDSVKAYNEEIKRISKEIEELIGEDGAKA